MLQAGNSFLRSFGLVFGGTNQMAVSLQFAPAVREFYNTNSCCDLSSHHASCKAGKCDPSTEYNARGMGEGRDAPRFKVACWLMCVKEARGKSHLNKFLQFSGASTPTIVLQTRTLNKPYPSLACFCISSCFSSANTRGFVRTVF